MPYKYTSFYKEIIFYYTLYYVQGFSPHVSPFTELNDMGSLLTRSGFVMTTVVRRIYTFKYLFYGSTIYYWKYIVI